MEAQDMLFTEMDVLSHTSPSHENLPLAARMRPRSISEFAGQEHILGSGKLLRNLIETDRFSSLIFWGPPGVGKTSLAGIRDVHNCCIFLMTAEECLQQVTIV